MIRARVVSADQPLRSPEDDAALVAQVRAGDARAFEALFRRHYAALRVFAQRLVGTADDARDVVHDVFLRIWISRASWPVTSSIRAYLFQSVRHAATDWRRRLQAQARLAREAAAQPDEALDDAEPGEDVNHRSMAVQRAIAALPERQRLVMVLRWTEDMPFAEIAGVLGVSVRGVEQHHQRAVTTLRQTLRPLLRPLPGPLS